MERSIAAIILRDGRVFAARRGPGGDLGSLWEFPGGKVEAGESDTAALERELMEEFGANIHARRLLAEESFSHGGKERLLAGWLAELLPGSALVPKEHDAMRWATLGELASLDLVESDRKLLPHLTDLVDP
jgi:8-oxo-dGTP diphosphatase